MSLSHTQRRRQQMLQHLSTRPPTTRPHSPNPWQSPQRSLVFFSFTLLFCSCCLLVPHANVCLRCSEADAFGHLMAWMDASVNCSWPMSPDTIGLCGALPGTPLSPPFYTSSTTLHPPPAGTEPHCVWCGHAHRPSLCSHFQKAQLPTYSVFLGLCLVKYLAGTGHEGQAKTNKKIPWWTNMRGGNVPL